jgi:hypothetical protein|tara:strand:+ start:972 stop:1622 length:651 start_codon:yes stop_codon:yes gene_type:complete
MRIFIGHDSRFKDVTKVCEASIRKYQPDADITWLDKEHLKKHGFYGRKDVEGESTEFSFTRFYVPMICNYQGTAMFCDNDFLWKCDPNEMRRYLKKSMALVKHKDYVPRDIKMDGVQNKSYPKKNWSSLMIFNNKEFKNKLSKEYLDNATPSQLHEFKFINDNDIFDLPSRYNCLVGYHNADKARALHYTNGTPLFDAYNKPGKYAEEWLETYKSL